MSADVLQILSAHGATTDAYLRTALGRLNDAPPRLVDAIAYSLLAGGKRIRPALVLETARVCMASNPSHLSPSKIASPDAPAPLPHAPTAAPPPSALAAAGAIELIHTFSLVHDDLPAMDDDDLRRGRATNHKVYGEAMAILAGDAMTTLAFECIARDAHPDIAPRLIVELARASGPLGMIGGQVLDIAGENQSLSLESLQRIHHMKTGALLAVACRLGAIAAGASDLQLDSLTRYGQNLGMAFQIVDDLLDVTATPEQLGKATHKDAAAGKNTYPSLIGVSATRAAADHAIQDAIDALAIFDSHADALRALARYVVERKS